MSATTKLAPSLPLDSMMRPLLRRWQTPPCTTEERVQRIEVMGQRITEYIRFFCQLGNLGGTSAEAKEKAVIAFYEQMVVVERQLGRIQGNLQLE